MMYLLAKHFYLPRIICFLLSSIFVIILRGQEISIPRHFLNSKMPIDVTSLGQWARVREPIISHDGNYVSYGIDIEPRKRITYVATTNSTWKKKFVGGSDAFFSDDNKTFIFCHADTIYLQKLQSDQLETISDVKNMHPIGNDKGTWMAYQIEKDDILVLRNLISGVERRFSEVDEYYYDNEGSCLLLQSNSSNTLRIVNLKEGSIKNIWESNEEKVTNCGFDKSGTQLWFLTNDSSSRNYIWHYKKEMASAEKLVSNESPGIDPNMLILPSGIDFSQNGKYIVFELRPIPDVLTPKPGTVPVDIWHYKDVFLQSEQFKRVNRKYITVVSIENKIIVKLEKIGDRVLVSPQQANADIAIVTDKQDILWWKRSSEQGCYIVSLQNGSRRLLYQGPITNIVVSPGGKYVVYFDSKKKSYVSFELKTGIYRHITKAISEPLNNEYYHAIPNRTIPIAVGIAGWYEKDSAVLLYDNYDIWQVDLAGKRAPLNITKGYGHSKKIKFRLVSIPEGIVTDSTSLLLTAFNVKTKFNGFYRCFPNRSLDPEKLVMGPFQFYRVDTQVPNNADAYDQGMKPLKARDVNTWIVKRQSATEAPNYFLTSTFKKFYPITDLQPQKNYNWLTTELITWTQFDGTVSQGILYKPENFNPNKKYPVIFSYYETFSFRMYEFPYPNFTQNRVDIPWFVSQGYLVFTPDIHFSIASQSGKLVGDAAVNSVVSAANYLARRPYVDGTRMGIQGHSFGGGETLYIITHSNLFAAACSASPTVSNAISAYLGIHTPNGKPGSELRMAHIEIGHDHIGATLWQRPDLYIKASPVFRADRVTTPLLILHNQGDGSCQWSQGIEMYMALRRLEKKVWLLQYDGEDHGVGGRNAIDFTVRLTQFFNHYLKNELPPKWMTQGIPASLKGIESGFELDSNATKY